MDIESILFFTKEYFWNYSENNFSFGNIESINKKEKLKVVAIDFGIKKSILNRLTYYGCDVIVLPCKTSIDKVLSYEPNGIFFSNGPGDPSCVYEGIKLSLIHI